MPTDVLIDERLDVVPLGFTAEVASNIAPSQIDPLDEVQPQLRANPVLAKTASQKQIIRLKNLVGSGLWAMVGLSVVMAAIFMIGLVGLTLDMFFLKLGKRFALPGTAGAHS